jgi:hypothetical protein
MSRAFPGASRPLTPAPAAHADPSQVRVGGNGGPRPAPAAPPAATSARRPEPVAPGGPRFGVERVQTEAGTAKLTAILHDGLRYEVPETQDRDLKEIERFLEESELPVADALLAVFDRLNKNPAAQQMMVDRAYREAGRRPEARVITAADVWTFLASRKGGLRILWVKMRRLYPDLTLERLEEMLTAATDAEIDRLSEESSGEYIARGRQAMAALGALDAKRVQPEPG